MDYPTGDEDGVVLRVSLQGSHLGRAYVARHEG